MKIQKSPKGIEIKVPKEHLKRLGWIELTEVEKLIDEMKIGSYEFDGKKVVRDLISRPKLKQKLKGEGK